MATLQVFVELSYLVGKGGARADQTHCSPQHVPELGDLVEAGRSEEATHFVTRGSFDALKSGPLVRSLSAAKVEAVSSRSEVMVRSFKIWKGFWLSRSARHGRTPGHRLQAL